MAGNHNGDTRLDITAFVQGISFFRENRRKIIIFSFAIIVVSAVTGFFLGDFFREKWQRTENDFFAGSNKSESGVEFNYFSENSAPLNLGGRNSEFSVFRIKVNEYLSRHLHFENSPAGQSVVDFISQKKIQLQRDGKRGIFGGISDFMAITGAMYEDHDHMPPGLVISGSIKKKDLNTGRGEGNFYNPYPNGVFFLKKNIAGIQQTSDFNENGNYDFAIQSGPLLIQNNSIPATLPLRSGNYALRCGIGIAREGKSTFIVFVSSKTKVNFHELAYFMKHDQGCNEALHLESINAYIHYPGSDCPSENKDVRNYIVIH